MNTSTKIILEEGDLTLQPIEKGLMISIDSGAGLQYVIIPTEDVIAFHELARDIFWKASPQVTEEELEVLVLEKGL